PIEPPAPVTFSTSTASFSVTFMCSARIRDMASEGPPAENGTMMVMGRDGKFCAAAGNANARVARTTAEIILRICFSNALFQNPHGEDLEPREIDRLVAIERARHGWQRIFKSRGAVK